MSKDFRVSIGFTNQKLDDAIFILDEIVQPQVQYGRWHIELDDAADRVLVDGKLHWRLDQYTHKKTECVTSMRVD